MSANLTDTEYIECSAQPLGICFHASRDILAAGLIDGTVELHDYSLRLPGSEQQQKQRLSNEEGGEEEEEDTILSSTQCFPADGRSTCRSVVFSPDDPNLLYCSSGGSGSVAAVYVDRACRDEPEQVAFRVGSASTSSSSSGTDRGIHRMTYLSPQSLLVTGDDAGVVRLWDARCHPCTEVASMRHHTDFVTGLATSPRERDHEHELLVSSADGTLSVVDLRKHAKTAQSVCQDDELLSLCVCGGSSSTSSSLDDTGTSDPKAKEMVVAGTQEGSLLVWTYGAWEDTRPDRLPRGSHRKGQPIDCLLALDDRTLLTGSGDGLVRVLGLRPDRFLGVLGGVGGSGFPVEEMALDRTRKWLGTIDCHEDKIRLWDTSPIPQWKQNKPTPTEQEGEQDSDDEDEEDWKDMDEDDDDDDDMDEDNDRENAKQGNNRLMRTERDEFFADFE